MANKGTMYQKIEQMIRVFNWPACFAQFTLDWVQDELPDSDVDGALAYRIETIREVLKPGPDHDFFLMLEMFSRIYQGESRPPQVELIKRGAPRSAATGPLNS
jgi:hypothetical protein